jgi:ATP-dependent RNA helicase DHX37/DHR1
MTNQDADVDEEREMERLRSILRNTEAHLQKQQKEPGSMIGKKRGRQDEDHLQDNGRESGNLCASLLENEHDDQNPVYGVDSDNALILPPKKKKEKTGPTIQLSPQEIRKAKLLQKNTNRKLKQLTTRVEQKKRRDELYSKLEASAISVEERQLLVSSANLGKRMSKKETLQRLLRKERAGLALTEEERSLLYTERTLADDVDTCEVMQPLSTAFAANLDARKGTERIIQTNYVEMTTNQDNELSPQKGTKRLASTLKTVEQPADFTASPLNKNDEAEKEPTSSSHKMDSTESSQSKSVTSNTASAQANFAAQMMASLSVLRAQTEPKQQQNDKESQHMSLEMEMKTEETSLEKVKPYVPSNPVVLKTAASMGLDSKAVIDSPRKTLEIKRPADVQATRYDLPVCGMEFEIMDAIRNNDVTIICGETGSGKSTQVPQFLYEAGFAESTPESEGKSFVIGVTQPRRVAAVSTAKRVCYEMGFGNGQKIGNGSKHGGNTVAYQTRYETAGLGSDTRVKFMTDGILLQEIQSDFLLRQYSVIILDEAHERNLNTDVLLGLLSVALPLRQQAAMEEGSGLVPLKLVIMSATLRVEDFTSNDVLFPKVKPMVVKVPGRTFPVTIHHSKHTELETYGA